MRQNLHTIVEGPLDPKSPVGGGCSPPRISRRRPGDASFFYLLLFQASDCSIIHGVRRQEIHLFGLEKIESFKGD